MIKTLLIKLGFFVILLVSIYAMLINKLSQGPVDELYYKFTQKSDGLILGLSRADKGIVPAILSDELNPNLHTTITNFASYQSFYGETYLKSIKSKLEDSNGKGIFILAVGPGSFSAPSGMTKEQIKNLDEKTAFGKVSNFTQAPNYDYLTCCYAYPLYNIFFNNAQWENLVSHQDGWNEVPRVTETRSITDSDIRHWTELTLRFSKQKIKKSDYSEYRFNYFLETISFLKNKGTVYLVRLPISNTVLQLENESWKEFDSKMENVATEYNIPYFSYTTHPNDYMTYDGSHLLSKSAIEFTKVLRNDMLASMSKD